MKMHLSPTTSLASLVMIVGLAATSGCGLPGQKSSSSSTPAPENPTQGIVDFQPVAGTTGSNDYAWSATGRVLSFRAEVQFAAAHTGALTVPWEIHTGSKTGPLVTSGSFVASDAGDGTHSFFDTPVQQVDLHTAPPGGSTIFIVLNSTMSLVAPTYQTAAYEFYRIQQAMIPTTM